MCSAYVGLPLSVMAAEGDQFWKALNRRDIDGVRQELVEKQPNKSERLNMVLDYLINNSERSYYSRCPLQNCYVLFVIMRSLEEKDRLTFLMTIASSRDITVFEKISGPLVFDILCPFYGHDGRCCGTTWCADMLRLIKGFVRDVISCGRVSLSARTMRAELFCTS